jgi:hypothetical protein
MIRSLHPFPARMAPEIAMAALTQLKPKSTVLDPMVGSGTVARSAAELGHCAIAFDMDPLAVLMTKVTSTPVDDQSLDRLMSTILADAKNLREVEISLPWIDGDEETQSFVKYWFGRAQRRDLRRLAFCINRARNSPKQTACRASLDMVSLALSRIIITKERGASLARDVSHSRPHRVTDDSDFEVMPAFEQSVQYLRRRLLAVVPRGRVDVSLGDARSLKRVADRSVDLVLTSPPYLNAIDYMRGHRLSLVWLGYRLSDLRQIRSNSVGAERGPDGRRYDPSLAGIRDAITSAGLPPRYGGMIARYSEDIYRFMSETARVLGPGGRAVLVIGDSCLRGTFVRNSWGIAQAAAMVGMRLLLKTERDLPTSSRYLPMPSSPHSALGKRLRTESVLTFATD